MITMKTFLGNHISAASAEAVRLAKLRKALGVDAS